MASKGDHLAEQRTAGLAGGDVPCGLPRSERPRPWSIRSAGIHPSPVEFTSVGTHELDDGSRWAQTIVVNFDDRRVIQLALYRFPLYM